MEAICGEAILILPTGKELRNSKRNVKYEYVIFTQHFDYPHKKEKEKIHKLCKQNVWNLFLLLNVI